MDRKFVPPIQMLNVGAPLLKLFMIVSFVGGSQDVSSSATSSVERSIAMSAKFGYSNIFLENGREHLHKDSFEFFPVPTTTSEQGHLSTTAYSEEIEALMAFKQALRESSSGTLDSWNSSDVSPCDWKGIKCSQQSGRVIAINLTSMGLVGSLSPLIGRLQYLQIIDLSDNFLAGELPPSLVNCTRLAYLALGNNRFSGQIPFHIGDLSQLQFLNLSTNFYLRGPIPQSLGNCSLLKLLRLDYTLIEGEIPDTVGHLSHLQTFNLTCTLNNGTIPRSLGNCSALILIALGNLYLSKADNIISPPPNLLFTFKTVLSGTLPEELGNLKRLQGLAIGGTNIHGPIPSWIANLTSLTGLGLELSQFSGEIPDFLGNLPLGVLGLSTNQFSGTIPTSISNCSNLWFLDLGGNLPLESTIPPELGLLKGLAVLVLADINLKGKIPSSLSNCSSLQILVLGQYDGFQGTKGMETQPLPSWVGSLVKLVDLYLAGVQLVGQIPIAIGQLSELESLSFGGNRLRGPIQKSLKNCTRLESLDVSSNQLTGMIPLELWELVHLQGLWIHDNQFTGSLSDGIANLTSLQIFECYGNSLNSTIPSRLSELSRLWWALLRQNKFNGYIPDNIGNLSALERLDISYNELTGSIPASMGNLSHLVVLGISDNWLSGSIPASLMTCDQLTTLRLHRNILVDNIPQEIGQLRSLVHLHLHENRLSGNLPRSLEFCSSLQNIDLSHNAFHSALPEEIFANLSLTLSSLNLSRNSFYGALPNSLGLLTGMTVLRVSNNNFSGPIPQNLGDCNSLESLDFSVNNFTGSVPASLGQLTELALLNLSYNYLQGPLPDSGGIFSSNNLSASWFSGNSGLCGSILPRKCSAHDVGGRELPCKGVSCRSIKAVTIILCSIFGLVAVGIGLCLVCRFWRAHERDQYCNSRDWHLQAPDNLNLTEKDSLKIIEEPSNLIGVGACSSVYKADLSESLGNIIAVKVFVQTSNNYLNLNRGDDGGPLQDVAACMYREAHALSQPKHRNVLRVLGIFSTPRITALMLEFMPMGSLHDQLHNMDDCALGWDKRLDIAMGVAQGLVYLHEEVQVPVIHRDLKPSNILLDANMTPKLGDFGISRFVDPNGKYGEVTTTHLCGTIGYIPPEYAGITKVSTAGDVYSYGVILLELITKRRPIMHATGQDQGLYSAIHSAQNPLVDWVSKVSRLSSSLVVIDPMLLENNHSSMARQTEQMKKLFVQVGLLCTQDNPQSRPRMYDVLNRLTHIQRLGHETVNVPTIAELAIV